ncbi:MAG: replication initiation protein [Lachnospiraceae bacterium]|nr:replication initiation protein [Lachnospiraceae bacterium]
MEKNKKKRQKDMKDFVIEKRNEVNSMINNEFSLIEYKIFCVYLSRINARDENTRSVEITIEDFQSVLGVNNISITAIRAVVERLSKRQIHIPEKNCFDQYKTYNVFSVCKIVKITGRWILQLDVDGDILPLIFDFKEQYVTYRLKNVIGLKSTTQMRMYEILKQYEKIGERELEISDLKKLLGISEKKYTRWDNLKKYVIDSCKEVLEKNTDLRFDYKRGGSEIGGKWITIVFSIYANPATKGHSSSSYEEDLDNDDLQPDSENDEDGFDTDDLRLSASHDEDADDELQRLPLF